MHETHYIFQLHPYLHIQEAQILNRTDTIQILHYFWFNLALTGIALICFWFMRGSSLFDDYVES